jgi:ribosomal protein S18 acetylase RimI-like enzyme
MLKIYYEVIASLPGGACGYVAREDGKFAGYVCGVWDGKTLRKALLKRWFDLALAAFQYFLYEPKVIPSLFGRLVGNQRSKRPSVDGYELRPIIVLKEFRGMGIADKLTERLLEDARQRGFSEVFLFTEFNNIPAIKFYIRIGFTLERDVEIDGNVYKQFRVNLS